MLMMSLFGCLLACSGTLAQFTGCATANVVQHAVSSPRASDAGDIVYRDDGIAIEQSVVDEMIPAPADVALHEMGDGAIRYDAMLRYMRAIADASPFVHIAEYAESHEGRTLYYLTISSEENLARLDEIQSQNATIADPRNLRGNGQSIIDNLPGIAWMAYSIHGDELSSTDAAMLVAHRLAAGTDNLAQRMRDGLVVFIDPLQNPDGRERYLAQLQSLQGKVPNTDLASMQHSGLWSGGRTNHYLFDLNRDWLTHVHPETRGRVNLIRSWHPHLLVDSHEMGGGDTYLFDPPREPLNPQLTEKGLEWRARFADDQAAMFDAHGWSYYGGEWYEEWGPFYTNAWANHLGAIGILYEQAGYNAASVKQDSGEITTYAQAVHRQYTSSMANLQSLLENKNEFLRDRLEARRDAVAEPDTGKVFVMPKADNESLQQKFLNVLARHGIEWEITGQSMKAASALGIDGQHRDSVALPAGSIIIRENQPQQRLLHAVLDFDPRMTDAFLLEERTEVEAGRGGFIYDVTGWNIPMSYGLESYWAEGVAADDAAQLIHEDQRDHPLAREPQYGYVIDCVDSDAARLLVRLFDAGIVVRVASKPIEIQGESFAAGAIVIRNHENGDDLRDALRQAMLGLSIRVLPVDTARTENGWDLGGRRIHLLHPPRVAIASQWPVSATSFGASWYLVDAQLGMRCSPINVQNLARMDLRMYNVLILPDAGGIGSILDQADRNLRQWVRNGGTLIAIGSSATTLARDGGMSDVRLRRDVLDELDVYAEAVARERATRSVKIDPALVWDGRATDQQQAEEADQHEAATQRPLDNLTGDALERADAWARRFSPSGAILLSELDQTHWLTFGAGATMPALFGGSSILMTKEPVDTPVRFADYDSLRLSGLLWPEARQRIANSAYATVERVGDGQVVLFADDPYFRANMEGTGRFLKNAILLGPGMGTDQPSPW